MVQHPLTQTRHTLAFPSTFRPDAMPFPLSRRSGGDWMAMSLKSEGHSVPQRPKTTLPISSTRVQERSEEFYTFSSSFEPIPVIPVRVHRDIERRGVRAAFPEQEGAGRPIVASERHRGYLDTGNIQSQPGRLSHSTTRTNSSTIPGLTLSGSGGTSTSRTLSHPSSRSKSHIQPQSVTTARPSSQPNHTHSRSQTLLSDAHPRLNHMLKAERAVKSTATVSSSLTREGSHVRLQQWRNEVARDAYTKTAAVVANPSKTIAHRERKLSLDARPQRQQQHFNPSMTLPSALLAPRIRSSRTVPPMPFQPAVSNPRSIGLNTQPNDKRRPAVSHSASIGRPRSSTPVPVAAVHSRLLAQTEHVARPRTTSIPRPTSIAPPSRPKPAVQVRKQQSKPLPSLPAAALNQRPSQPEQSRKVVYREYEYDLADELVSLCSGVDSVTGQVMDYGGQTVKVNGLGQNVTLSQGPGGTQFPYRNWYARPNDDDVVDISTERANSPSEY